MANNKSILINYGSEEVINTTGGLLPGKTATLKTSGRLLKNDIEVVFPSNYAVIKDSNSTLNITANGLRDLFDKDAGAYYTSVNVDVSAQPTLKKLSVTKNGTYTANDDNADGYSEVEVTVDAPTDITPDGNATAFKVVPAALITGQYTDYQLFYTDSKITVNETNPMVQASMALTYDTVEKAPKLAGAYVDLSELAWDKSFELN